MPGYKTAGRIDLQPNTSASWSFIEYPATSATANDGSGVTGTLDIEVTGGGPSAIDNNQNTSFTIYPNPVNEILYISNAEKIQNISIIDVTGSLVHYDQNESDLMSIHTDKLESGLYFIRIETKNNQVYYNKFIKE